MSYTENYNDFSLKVCDPGTGTHRTHFVQDTSVTGGISFVTCTGMQQ